MHMYKDSTQRHTHTHTVLSLITCSSAFLDLLDFAFFLDYPLSQTSYQPGVASAIACFTSHKTDLEHKAAAL